MGYTFASEIQSGFSIPQKYVNDLFENGASRDALFSFLPGSIHVNPEIHPPERNGRDKKAPGHRVLECHGICEELIHKLRIIRVGSKCIVVTLPVTDLDKGRILVKYLVDIVFGFWEI